VSLSNDKIISVLKSRFVSVFTSNEDFSDRGSASPEERAELRRIHKEGYDKGLSVGTVHAYVISPDGHLMDSLHTVMAAKPELMLAMLEKTSRKLSVQDGTPLIKPEPPAHPKAGQGELLLYLTSRYLERKGAEYALVHDAGGNWSALPAEDWITLSRPQIQKLLPSEKPKIGARWEIDREAAALLLKHYYPPTENSDVSSNRIDEQTLTATVDRIDGSRVHCRLEGRMKMKHTFYHKDDDRFVESTLAGYMGFDTAKRTITSLKLVTDQAEYKGGGSGLAFGAVMKLVTD
jgi:hypothetical protein